MNEEQSRHYSALIPSSTRALVTRSSTLVRRGLEAALSLQKHFIYFPQDRSMGTLHMYNLQSKRWDEELGEARGAVEVVSEGKELGLVVSDDASKDLSPLTALRPDDLQLLYLSETQVNDAELVHLRKLNNLKGLNLSGTNIADAGLAFLRGLVELRWLDLRGTQVSVLGIANLKLALPNCHIIWHRAEKEEENGTDEEQLRQAVFSIPLTLRYVIALGEKLEKVELEARHVFGDDEDEIETAEQGGRLEFFLSRMTELKRLAGERDRVERLLRRKLPKSGREQAMQRLAAVREQMRTTLSSLQLGRRHITIAAEKLKESGNLLEHYQRLIQHQEEQLQRKASEIASLARTLKARGQQTAKLIKELGKAQVQKVLEASVVIQDARKEIRKIESDTGTSTEELRRCLEVICREEGNG